MMTRYAGITRADLFDQHDFFMERARKATTRAAKAEAIKKAGTTRRMIAHDPTLREWVLWRAA